MAQQYGCWVGGCAHVTDFVVSNPATPLVQPLETCRDHLGDLLGNAAKAALAQQPDDLFEPVALHITRLA